MPEENEKNKEMANNSTNNSGGLVCSSGQGVVTVSALSHSHNSGPSIPTSSVSANRFHPGNHNLPASGHGHPHYQQQHRNSNTSTTGTSEFSPTKSIIPNNPNNPISSSQSHSQGHSEQMLSSYSTYQIPNDNHMQNKRKGNSSVRDPLSHRIIEKRRRDRMNNCLADLARLLPQASLRKGRGRIEKTEIVELAIRHLKHLQFHKCEFGDACEFMNSGTSSRKSPCSLESGESDCLSSKSFRLGYEECFSECLDYLSSKSPAVIGRNALMDMIEHLLSFRTQSFNYNNHFNKSSSLDSGTNSRIDEMIMRIKNSEHNMNMRNTTGTENSDRESQDQESVTTNNSSSFSKNININMKSTFQSNQQQQQQSEEMGYDFGGETSCCSSPLSVVDSCEGGESHGGNRSKPPIPTIVGGSSCNSASILSGSRSSDEGSSSTSHYSNEHKYTKFKSTIKQRFINQEISHESEDQGTGENEHKSQSQSPPPILSIVNLAELREPELGQETESKDQIRNLSSNSTRKSGNSNSCEKLIPGFVLCEKGLFYIPITLEKSVVDPYFQALADQNEYLESTKLFPPLHPITINVCFLLKSPNNSGSVQSKPASVSTSISTCSSIYTNSTVGSQTHSENLFSLDSRGRNLSITEDPRSIWTKQQNNLLAIRNANKAMRKRTSDSLSISSSPGSSLGYWSNQSQSTATSPRPNFSPSNSKGHGQGHGHGQPQMKPFPPIDFHHSFPSNLNLNPMFYQNELNLALDRRNGPLSMKSDDGQAHGHGHIVHGSLKKPKRNF